MHELAKGFCLSMVHTGVSNSLSQNAIIDNYVSGFEGMNTHYEHISEFVKSSHQQVTLSPLVKVSLNSHNIIKAEIAILDAYKHDEPDYLYKKIHQSPFYSLMHDGISKFGAEYNGVYLRGITSDHQPFFVPYCLSKMKGGVTGMDTAQEIISNVASFMSISDSAYVKIGQCLLEEALNPNKFIQPTPPVYFKLGKLSHVDHKNKEINIQIDNNFPVGNMGDGVAVNNKGARILRDLFGLESPDYRCAAHSSSGTVETDNIQYYECP